jgi:putative ABC transport system substrate-binding protein
MFGLQPQSKSQTRKSEFTSRLASGLNMNDTQKQPLRQIGILEMASPDRDRLALWDIFKRRLRELGHFESQNIAFQFRWAKGRQERLAGAAAELVRANVDVLVTAGTPAAAAASQATGTIPIIMATGVGLGTQLTEGASKPNANMTGISDLPAGVSELRLQLLHEAIGGRGTLAILVDRANPSSTLALRETQDVARSLGIVIRDYWVAGPDQFGETISTMRNDGIGGFVIAPGAMFFAQRKTLAALAREHRLPSMSVRREYAEAGCLMAYGAPIHENYRQAAAYVSQVLNGVKPADLPIAEPTEFDFIVNLSTASAIGLAVPQSLLARAETISP